MKGSDPAGERLPPEWVARWSLLRVLYVDRRFRVLLGVLLGLGMGLVLLEVRWVPGHRWPDGRGWRMTGWGWLERQGLKSGWMGSGDPVRRWQRRVELDPADLEGVRGYVEALSVAGEISGGMREQGRDWGGWLLRLGGTNAADVGRVLRWGMASGTDWGVVEQLQPYLGRLGDEDRLQAVRVLAEAGRWTEVGPLIAAEPKTDESVSLRLHRWAWQVGWGGGSVEGMKGLREATGRAGEEGVLAKRLLMRVLVERMELVEARRVLEALREGGGARLSDHLELGWARVRTGDGAGWGGEIAGWPEAERAEEWMSQVELLRAVGERNRGRRELEKGLERWGDRAGWVRLADLSVEDGDWRGVRRAGVGLRGLEGGADGTAAMGWAMEAMALERMGNVAESGRAWMECRREREPEGVLAWEWGRRVAEWGWPREGWDWLVAGEEAVGGRLDYWRVRLRAAHAMGDAEEILTGARRVRVLSPADPDSANELAAALLVLRRDPGEALRLATAAGVGRAARVNRALALVQLEEWKEAETALAALELQGLTGIERTMVCFGRFEMHSRAGSLAAALEAYRGIDGKHLLPVQLRWLEGRYGELMRPASDGGGGNKLKSHEGF